MSKDKLAQVFHFDLYGKREDKYNFLNDNDLKDIEWNELEVEEPNYFFVKKDFSNSKEYEEGFKIDILFKTFASGLTTERDSLTIHFDDKTLNQILEDLKSLEPNDIREKYNEKPDGRDWKIKTAKEDVLKNSGKKCIINYRPFDLRKSYYTGKSKGFMAYPRNEVMQHVLDKDNIVFISKRGFDNLESAVCFATKYISDRRGWSSPGMQGAENIFPLYLYPESNTQLSIGESQNRVPNLNLEIVQKIADGLSLKFVSEKNDFSLSEVEDQQLKNASTPLSVSQTTFAPIDLLDYIYAVLHSPNYREKYKEFLKIDFPRVPYPANNTIFWQLVKIGTEIRQIHLLESPEVENYITQYPVDGDNKVDKPKYIPILKNQETKNLQGDVYINDTQYFANVPLKAWSFYIGGYQPAQKWLKDRKGRELSLEDILHYQKIIVALNRTSGLMAEIDRVLEV